MVIKKKVSKRMQLVSLNYLSGKNKKNQKYICENTLKNTLK